MRDSIKQNATIAYMSMTPELAVIDYGMGNLRSVAKAWEHEGASVWTVSEPKEVGQAAALILPGVGAFGDCMAALNQRGWADFIRGWIRDDRPFFGICLGFQALFERSEEGAVAGLGIFPGEVLRFDLAVPLKVPHMGWNTVRFCQDTPLNEGLADTGESFYFVHSYYVRPEAEALVWCESEYGIRFASGIASGSCFATQFHPEKSQAKGLALYRNFIELVGSGKNGLEMGSCPQGA